MPNPRGRFDLGTIRAPLLLDRVSSAIDLINVRRVVSACGNVGEVRSHLAAFKRRLAHVEPDVRSAALVTQRREYVARELVHEGLLWKYVKEACSAITRVTACTLALSPIRDTLTGGFSHFVASMTAPVASGWSGLPGGAYTHWKAPPLHGAHPNRTSRLTAATIRPDHCVMLGGKSGDRRLRRQMCLRVPS
jgi:hypothetical protein